MDESEKMQLSSGLKKCVFDSVAVEFLIKLRL